MNEITPAGAKIAAMIDHTLLKAETVPSQIVKACQEATTYGFATVCVHPALVSLVAKELAGSKVKPCTVVGFPFGATTTAVKAFEADDAIRNGAKELDMVLAVGALKNGETRFVSDDMKAVVDAAGEIVVKVILETCLLTDAEKITACRLALDAGISFVKTSTGLSTGGATVEDVRLMRRVVGSRCGVKASGGIRTLADAQKMVEAGANRIGTSAGVAIVTS